MAYNVNTDLVRGDDLFLYVFDTTGVTAFSGIPSGTTVVAFATSCSLQIDGETIDTSNKMSCVWNSNLAGKNGYTVSADALYTDANGATSFDTLLGKMVAGNAVGWAIAPASEHSGSCTTNDFTIDKTNAIAAGYGLITSLSLNAGNNEVASCSVTITGSGELITA